MLARLPPSLPRAVEQCVVWVRRRKTPVGAGVVAAAACAAAIIVIARGTAFVPLFDAPLHTTQAGEVAQALTLWNEPFQTGSQGTQVYVAAGRRKDVLLKLVMAGLPHRYVPTTADVLQTPDGPLTPQTVVDDRRRSGIEGDLVASLRRVDGVADASVVIAPAAGDLFADQAQRTPPSASVQLIAQPGAILPASTVAGVRRFVAAAYPGLTEERVTMVDGAGAVLNVVTDRSASKESRVQSAVQSALDAVLSSGVAVVRVSVRAAPGEHSVQTTRVTPHGLLDADTGRERGTENGRKLDKERTTRHYAYDTVVERRTSPPDAIGTLSVAVFLDAARVDAGKTQTIAALVRAAAGADLQAGDDVVVETVPFAPHATVTLTPAAPRPVLGRAILPATAAVALTLLGLFAWPHVAAARRTPPLDGETARLRAMLDRESPHAAAYVLSNVPRTTRERVLQSASPARRATIEAWLGRDRRA